MGAESFESRVEEGAGRALFINKCGSRLGAEMMASLI